MSIRTSPSYEPRPTSQAFGKYHLFERIGAGGMAEVFRAVAVGPENFQRSLVIKRILPHLSQDSTFVRMFIDEAKVSGLLSHPNLVQIFEFGQVGENYFIAMEHVRGRTLASAEKQLSKRGQVAPIAASVEIARQLCAGLDYAHALRSVDGQPLGIVHRDISPSNLMLSFHGVVKILDFGIARVAEGLRQTSTQVGALKGKISYMSPEQIQLTSIDGRSDIFSVGVVLHELLSGRRLFRGPTDYHSSRLVMEMPIQPPSAFNSAVPPALDRAVLRALEREVNARYDTAGEMAAELEQVIAESRLSPREHIRMMRALFPDEAAGAADTGLAMTSVGARADSEECPTPLIRLAALDPLATESGDSMVPPAWLPSASAQSSVAAPLDLRSRSRRRVAVTLLAAAALAGAAVLIARRGAGKSPSPAIALAVPATVVAGTGDQQGTVRCSLDSTPQDATVVRLDSGENIGRTPLTVALPRSTEVLAFSFQKAGYRAAQHKIIPDVEKAVRVDLVAESPEPPAAERLVAAAASAPRPGGPVQSRKIIRRPKIAPHHTSPSDGDPAKSVRAARPIDPFSM